MLLQRWTRAVFEWFAQAGMPWWYWAFIAALMCYLVYLTVTGQG